LPDPTTTSKNAVYPVDMVELILSRDSYISHYTSFINIQVVNYTTSVFSENSVTLSYTLIVVTDDTAIYEVRLDFDSNSDTNPKPLVGASVLFTF
jgi:hypothetical protein